MISLVSVIVPIYNVEKYLDKCVESIVNQTYKNLEIILVDDGSPDSCPQICDKWAEKDNRIKVIHKENGGVSSARNAGLDIAKGDFICFIDSDDTALPNMIEMLIKSFEKYNCDLSVCNIQMVDENGNVVEFSDYESGVFYDKLVASYLQMNFARGPWNKLYLKNIIKENNILFDENLTFGEDDIFNYNYIKKCSCVCVIENALYSYLVTNPNSASYGLSYGYLNTWRIPKKFMELEFENSENYSIAATRYFSCLAVISAKLLTCNDKKLLKKYFPPILIEIKNNYSLLPKAKGLSKIKYLSIKLIRISPSLFKIMFKLYSKVFYK